MDNDNVISTLNNLIETCRDGQNGFKEASENVESPELKKFFNEIVLERSQFAGELQQEVQRLGGDPENTGSTAGAIHRAWMDIKGSLTGRDDHSILNECESGEDSALNAYRDALKDENLPRNIRSIVERQFNSVQQVHNRVKQLRDSRSATSGR
ncbi:MAG TPA: PA2169 family four-helix-bundle protein [Blastocatellia bacterium]|nr:PA2169 family four-helix-bundle protein [Blastocatellia bacterium]